MTTTNGESPDLAGDGTVTADEVLEVRRSSTSKVLRLIRGLAAPQLVGVILLFVLGTSTIDGFGTRSSIVSLLVIASFLGFAAAGQTIVVIVGGIDLSIPFVIGAANVMMAEYTGDHWPLVINLLVIAVVAVIIGTVNGLASRFLNIHSLIVTLATGAIVQGALLVWTKGQSQGAAPDWLTRAVSIVSHTGPIPLPPVVVFWAVVVIAVSVVLSRFGAARSLYAIGANDRAARLTLVRSTAAWTSAFVFSSLMSAVAGVALTGFSSTGYLDIGQPYLFTSIAAVVVGGTSLLGARGNYWWTVLGTLMLTEIQTIMVGHGYSQAAQQVVLGAVIIVVMALIGRGEPVGRRI